MHSDVSCGEDAGRIESEEVRLASRVTSDDHTALTGARIGSQQVSGEAGRGLADDQSVHPHRSGADSGAETRGAELQATVEPLV